MATYRLIHQQAETGARSSALSDLGFCVWISYQLAADDFGVCPATAAKLQGASPRLEKKAAKAVQAEIEQLIAVGLCRVFTDGPQRYLYQADWQDWQRLKHATATALPAVPAELLEKCSPKTRALFEQFHPKLREAFSVHAGACDAPANADASGSSEGGSGETVELHLPRRRALIVSGQGFAAAHAGHVGGGFCTWMCLPDELVSRYATRLHAGPDAVEQVIAWAQGIRESWQRAKRVPTGTMWQFWEARWTEAHGDSNASTKGVDVLAGVKAVANGR